MNILIILVRAAGCLDFIIAILALVGYAYLNISIPTFTPLSGITGQIVMLIIWSYFSMVCFVGISRAFASVRMVLSTNKEVTPKVAVSSAKIWLTLSTLCFLLDTIVGAVLAQLLSSPINLSGMWACFGILEVLRISVLCTGFRYLWVLSNASEPPELENARYTEDHGSFHI